MRPTIDTSKCQNWDNKRIKLFTQPNCLGSSFSLSQFCQAIPMLIKEVTWVVITLPRLSNFETFHFICCVKKQTKTLLSTVAHPWNIISATTDFNMQPTDLDKETLGLCLLRVQYINILFKSRMEQIFQALSHLCFVAIDLQSWAKLC